MTCWLCLSMIKEHSSLSNAVRFGWTAFVGMTDEMCGLGFQGLIEQVLYSLHIM